MTRSTAPPLLPRAAAIPAAKLRDGSAGDDGTLAAANRPVAGSSRITLVNVPPVSTPITAPGGRTAIWRQAGIGSVRKRWATAECIAIPTAIASSLRIMWFEWQEATCSWSCCPSGITPRNIMQPGMRCST